MVRPSNATSKRSFLVGGCSGEERTLTNDPVALHDNSTWQVMSHLKDKQDHFDSFGNLYGLRTWIEYGFKQCKDQLGWADYRVTQYIQIERWWEIVSSAYLMVSLQFWGLAGEPPAVQGRRPIRSTHPVTLRIGTGMSHKGGNGDSIMFNC